MSGIAALAGTACVLACAAGLAGLAGCATPPAAGVPASSSAREVPQLRLAPALLGHPLALQQRIAVQAPGQARQLDVLLEADAAHVRLAVLAMGQVAARLDWDGVTLDETRAPWWPPQVSGARILSDLQLSLWPVAAIQAALSGGWRVAEEGAVRTLYDGGEIVATVTRRGADVIEIAQRRAPYTLTITSQPLEAQDGAASGVSR